MGGTAGQEPLTVTGEVRVSVTRELRTVVNAGRVTVVVTAELRVVVTAGRVTVAVAAKQSAANPGAEATTAT